MNEILIRTRTRSLRILLLALLLMLALISDGADRAVATGEPSTTWAVTLVGPDGQVVPGARVTLQRIEALEERQRRWLAGRSEPPVEEVVTGADGVARLTVPGGNWFAWRAEAPGFLPAVHWSGGSELHGLPSKIRLTRDPGLELRVQDPEGRPLPGARVHRRHVLAGAPAVTGDDGWTRSAHPTLATKPGEPEAVPYRVVPPPGRADLSPTPWLEVGAPPGEPFRGEVVLAPARPHRLRVLDPDGDPAPGVLVRLVNSESPRPHDHLSLEVPLALGGKDGVVEIPRPLSGEPVTLRLVSPDLNWATVELAPPADSDEAAATPSTVHLRPPGALHLRVVDRLRGEPVPGAQVLIYPSFAGRTEPDGGLALRWPSPTRVPYDRHPVQVSAAGFEEARLPLDRDPEAGDGTPRTIRLTPLANLSGRVLATDGRPVAGARILLSIHDSPFSPGRFPSRNHPSGGQTSGPDGRFRVVGPPPQRTLVLRAEVAGHAPAEVAVPAVEAGESRQGIEIILPPGHRGQATVLGPEGAPVSGTTLEVSPHGPGQGDLVRSAPVDCNADGRCSVASLSAGRFDLRATAPGHAATRRRGVEVPADGGIGAPVDFGVLYLEPEAEIAGRVSADGNAVTGARVWVTRDRGDNGDDPLPEAESGDDGVFSLGGLAAGTRLHVHVHAEGHPPLVVPSVEAPRRDLELEIPPGAEVRGRVVDATGAPVEGAHVTARPPFGPNSPPRFRVTLDTVSGSDGAFLLDALPAGDLTLEAGDGSRRSETAVRLEPGERLDGVRLVLEAGDEVRVAGRVTDSDGRPLAGARVALMARRPNGGQNGTSTSADHDGIFSFGMSTRDAAPNEDPVTFDLQVDHPGYLEHRRPLGTAAELAALGLERHPLFIVLAEGGTTVSGVIAGEDGEPVAGATVLLEIPTGPAMSVGFRSNRSHLSMSGPDGTFVFRDVEPGRWVLNAQHPAWTDGELDDPVEVGTTPVEGLRLVLERGATLLVRVVGLDPRELAGVRLHASPLGRSRGFFGLEGRPDHEGVARLAGAWPGEWRLTASLDGGSRARRLTATVTPGDREVAVEVPFGSGARLSGELRVNGEPRSGVRLSLSRLDLMLNTVTGPEGRFSFPEIADGEYQLSALEPRVERRLTVEGERHLRLDLEAGTLAGRVVDEAGEPVAARVELIQLRTAGTSGARHPAVTQSGLVSFRFEVAPGLYGLRISAAGHQTRELEVQAVAGASSGEMIVVLPADGPPGP